MPWYGANVSIWNPEVYGEVTHVYHIPPIEPLYPILTNQPGLLIHFYTS